MKHIAVFAVFVLLVVGLLFTLTGNKSPRIPDDENHVAFTVEESCWECHGPEGDVPRRETHPPKDQCLECHKVKDNRRRGKCRSVTGPPSPHPLLRLMGIPPAPPGSRSFSGKAEPPAKDRNGNGRGPFRTSDPERRSCLPRGGKRRLHVSHTGWRR